MNSLFTFTPTFTIFSVISIERVTDVILLIGFVETLLITTFWSNTNFQCTWYTKFNCFDLAEMIVLVVSAWRQPKLEQKSEYGTWGAGSMAGDHWTAARLQDSFLCDMDAWGYRWLEILAGLYHCLKSINAWLDLRWQIIGNPFDLRFRLKTNVIFLWDLVNNKRMIQLLEMQPVYICTPINSIGSCTQGRLSGKKSRRPP